VALASDWAADALSPPGRAKLWRALAELGLPGLHHKLIRQRSEGGEDVRPWLTPSGVLGYRALAAAYPDYAPRAAEMEAELTSALQVAFDDTGQRVGGGNIAELEAVWPALLALARHHGHPLSQCLPPPLLRAGTWLRAMTGVVGPAGTPLPVGHTPIHSPPPYLTAEVLANLTDTPPWTAPPGQTPPAIGSPLHLLLAATLPFEAGPTDRPEPPPAAALPTLTVLPRAGSFVLRHADPRFGPTLFHATAGSTQQPAHHCDVGAILWQIKDQPLLVDPGGGPDRGSIQHHTAVVPLDPQGEPREPNGSGRLIGVHPWGPGCLAAFDLSPAYQAVQPAEATDGCSLSRRIIAADPRMIVLEDLLRSPSPPQLASRTLFITTQPAETIHYELGGMTHTAYRVSVGTSAVLWICCVNWQPATVRCDELTFSGKPQHLHRLCLDTAAAPDLRCLTALQLLPAGSADRPDPFWPLAPHVFTTNDGRLTLRQQPNAELSLTRIEPDGQEHHARFANGSWHLAPEDLATEDP